MAILIQEVSDEPGCAGCGCVLALIPLTIIYFNRDAIITGLISFLGGLMTVVIWIIGIIVVSILGYHLIKNLQCRKVKTVATVSESELMPMGNSSKSDRKEVA